MVANKRPWFNQEVRELLIRDAPSRAKDAASYRLAIFGFRAGNTTRFRYSQGQRGSGGLRLGYGAWSYIMPMKVLPGLSHRLTVA